jgi:hypothetical protein
MAAGEIRKRSIVKMLTYRAILTALLAIISWIFTGNFEQTTIIMIVFNVSGIIIIIHTEFIIPVAEIRIWNRRQQRNVNRFWNYIYTQDQTQLQGQQIVCSR